MSVRHLEVGSDVGHVDVVTLFEEVESERAFFVDDKGDRVGENTVLENDGVTH